MKISQNVSVAGMVLIDTWWNVNLLTNSLDEIKTMVLIDTWWNVNKT